MLANDATLENWERKNHWFQEQLDQNMKWILKTFLRKRYEVKKFKSSFFNFWLNTENQI
jgi:hypothetical protein